MEHIFPLFCSNKSPHGFQEEVQNRSLVALSAIFISTATLFVYIYQAGIMQKQLRTAVWPHIEWLKSVNVNSNGLYLEVQNKGIGPARVKKVNLYLDDKPVADLTEMFQVLTDSSFAEYFGYSIVEGRVMGPGESIIAFEIADGEMGKRIWEALKARNFRYTICYCSVYDECWTSTGTVVTESECE